MLRILFGLDSFLTLGHDSYARVVKEQLGQVVIHHNNQYLNNRLEQDHRGIKQRYYHMMKIW